MNYLKIIAILATVISMLSFISCTKSVEILDAQRIYEEATDAMESKKYLKAGELWDIYKLDVVVIPTNKPVIRDDREDLVFKTKGRSLTVLLMKFLT